MSFLQPCFDAFDARRVPDVSVTCPACGEEIAPSELVEQRDRVVGCERCTCPDCGAPSPEGHHCADCLREAHEELLAGQPFGTWADVAAQRAREAA
jgi:hypothetical protein